MCLPQAHSSPAEGVIGSFDAVTANCLHPGFVATRFGVLIFSRPISPASSSMKWMSECRVRSTTEWPSGANSMGPKSNVGVASL
jgi:hypothetical protein